MDEIKKEYINDNGENYEIIKEEKKEYINDNGERVVEHKIYLLKIDNKWKGQKTYYDKNKEILKKKIIISKRNRYQNDEEYREKVKSKRREAYARKKLEENK
jgi:hypothetical protein